MVVASDSSNLAGVITHHPSQHGYPWPASNALVNNGFSSCLGLSVPSPRLDIEPAFVLSPHSMIQMIFVFHHATIRVSIIVLLLPL